MIRNSASHPLAPELADLADRAQPACGAPIVSGIVHETKGLPDFFICRALERLTHRQAPLQIAHTVTSFDLSGDRVTRVRKRLLERLLHEGWKVEISEQWEFGWEAVFAAEHGDVLHTRISVEDVLACAFSRTNERANEIVRLVEQVARGLSARRSGGGHVAVRFWYLGERGPASYVRRVQCPRWDEIASNYPAGAPQIAPLMALHKPHHRGHFVFWHGPAGTGKTSAVRALIREWRDMDAEVITDPDAFLQSPEYLNELVIDPTEKSAGGGKRTRRGRLLILEDAPELMQGEQGSAARSTLAKLLNISDGILRHELRLVILATTHERSSVPASALTRPGRCLQVLEFPRLDADQTARWLEQRRQQSPCDLHDASLAELFARVGPDGLPAFQPSSSIGFAARGS